MPRPRTLRTTETGARQVTGALVAALTYFQLVQAPANAKVFLDTQVYGDRELVVATINKCKQKIRNAIVESPELAGELFNVAINDALGFDVASGEGGPDGSLILDAEAKRTDNAGLLRALQEVQRIKKELQRTNALSFADVISFAGAEALEALGCPRVVVQVGRVDSTTPNTKGGIDFSNDTGADILNRFASSGVTKADTALLLGAVGEIRRILAETAAAAGQKTAAVEDDDDKLDGDESFQEAVPSTFGSMAEIFGKRVGKGFTSRYLSTVLKDKGGPSTIDRLLFDDAALRSVLSKYAGNDKAFTDALIPAYLRLSLLGAAYSTRNS